MIIKAVQQFMLGTVLNNEAQVRDTLQKMKEAGYDCLGVTMKLHSTKDVTTDGCVTTQDIEDARRVCQKFDPAIRLCRCCHIQYQGT